jgi:hypothetical protein
VIQSYVFRDDYFPYSVHGGEDPSHVLLPYRLQTAQLLYGHRFGEPGKLWTIGGGVSRETLEFPEGPEGLRTVAGGEFDDLLPATEAEVEEVSGQMDPLKATRLSLFGGFRRIDFVVRNGLDAVTAPQDVMVGTELNLSLNPSLGTLGGLEGTEDLQLRADFFWAKAPEPWVLNVDVTVEGRHLRDQEASGDEWRDILSEVNGRVFLQPERLRNHTVFGRISATRSWSMERPFQLTGGGREGVRGYSRDAFPGGRRILVSLEDRFPIFSREMLDAGLAFFGDLGRVWGQDVPYGVDSGWRSSVGAGLRLNIPGGALRTVRADFTLPLSGDRDVHGIYFRFYTELGGLLQTPKRPGQVERSRWSGPDTNVTGSRPSG